MTLASISIKHYTGNPDHDSPEGQKRHAGKRGHIEPTIPVADDVTQLLKSRQEAYEAKQAELASAVRTVREIQQKHVNAYRKSVEDTVATMFGDEALQIVKSSIDNATYSMDNLPNVSYAVDKSMEDWFYPKMSTMLGEDAKNFAEKYRIFRKTIGDAYTDSDEKYNSEVESTWQLQERLAQELINLKPQHIFNDETNEMGRAVDATGGWLHDMSYDDSVWSEKDRAYKDLVARDLSKSSGISYDQASYFIKQWAEHSNDGDYRSLSIQEAAADEFDVSLVPWQKKIIRDIKKSDPRGHKIIQMAATYSQDDLNSMLEQELKKSSKKLTDKARLISDSISFSEEMERDDHIAPKVETEMGKLLDIFGSTKTSKATIRKALRAMYKATQQDIKTLKLNDDGTIYLYRAIGTSRKLTSGRGIKIKLNALESWTSDPSVALNWKSGAGNVLMIKIKPSRVLSTPRTGFGCLNEYEFVLLGGVVDEAFVLR